MKIKYIFFPCVVALLTSCSSSYRTGQTPDDVYYSPAPSSSPSDNSYVNTVSDQGNSYSYDNDGNSQTGNDVQSSDDNYYVTYDSGDGYSPYGDNSLSYNPYLFNSYGMGSSFYGYDPLAYMNFFNPFAYNYYGYSGLMGYYNPYTFYSPYSVYANAYYGHSSAVTFATTNNYRPRTYNLNAYTNTSTTNAGAATAPSPIRRTSGVGNVIRRVFTPNRGNNNYYTPSNGNRSYNNPNNNGAINNQQTPTRTFNNDQAPTRTFNSTPSAPSVSTPSSSGGGSAPVRTFGR